MEEADPARALQLNALRWMGRCGWISETTQTAYFDIDDYQQGYGESVQEYLRPLLVDEVFTQDDGDDEAQLNPGALFSRLREGKTVFRTSD